MSDNQATDSGVTSNPPAPSLQGAQEDLESVKPGFVRRYRLPIFLAVVAICLYASSILYFVYGKGQVA